MMFLRFKNIEIYTVYTKLHLHKNAVRNFFLIVGTMYDYGYLIKMVAHIRPLKGRGIFFIDLQTCLVVMGGVKCRWRG